MVNHGVFGYYLEGKFMERYTAQEWATKSNKKIMPAHNTSFYGESQGK